MPGDEYARVDRSEAMRTAVSVARFAPSLHNTQPWQWRLAAGSMDLHTDRSRHMRVTDPKGRLMILSCGAALRYARIALQIQGFTHPSVHRIEHGRAATDEVLLARLTPAEHEEPTPASMHELRLMMQRHTDRGPVRDEPVPAGTLERLQQAGEKNDAQLHLFRDRQVTELAAITGQAQRLAEADPRRQAELDEWSTAHQRDGIGVPRSNVNTRPGRVRVTPRRFGPARPLPPVDPAESPTDAAATYAVVHVPVDTPPAWLRAGEALVAIWLAATAAGVAVQPFSEAIEADTTRTRLTTLLGDTGYPMLVLRFGLAERQPLNPPATPRLSVSQILREATRVIPAEPGQPSTIRSSATTRPIYLDT